MSRRFRLSRRARADLEAIGRFTARHWGKQKRDSYLAGLYRRMAWLAKDPQRGRRRPELADGAFAYPQGSHIVFYLVAEQEILIIGVPHQAMDLRAHLERGTWE